MRKGRPNDRYIKILIKKIPTKKSKKREEWLKTLPAPQVGPTACGYNLLV